MGDLAFTAGFISYGTKVQFRSNEGSLLEEVVSLAHRALLGSLREVNSGPFPLIIDVTRSRRGLRLERNGAYISQGGRNTFFKFLNAIIRVSVAEFSPELVFLHAGAVGWKGKGIVMPADSFSGKSSLVTELVKLGAEYYSDDFAILDSNGELRPFPRQISMRTRELSYSVYEVDPLDLGTTGSKPLPVGLVLLTRYKHRTRWNPQVLTPGDGLLRTIPFALGMSQHPENCISVLKKVTADARMISTLRGEADRTAARLLDFFDSNVI